MFSTSHKAEKIGYKNSGSRNEMFVQKKAKLTETRSFLPFEKDVVVRHDLLLDLYSSSNAPAVSSGFVYLICCLAEFLNSVWSVRKRICRGALGCKRNFSRYKGKML